MKRNDNSGCLGFVFCLIILLLWGAVRLGPALIQMAIRDTQQKIIEEKFTSFDPNGKNEDAGNNVISFDSSKKKFTNKYLPLAGVATNEKSVGYIVFFTSTSDTAHYTDGSMITYEKLEVHIKDYKTGRILAKQSFFGYAPNKKAHTDNKYLSTYADQDEVKEWVRKNVPYSVSAGIWLLIIISVVIVIAVALLIVMKIKTAGLVKRKVIKFGKYPQRKNQKDTAQPIEWLVLDEQEGKSLLISKYALDTKAYNDALEPITWEKCTLRSWLNEKFLNFAFTVEEQKKIEKVQVTADDNQNKRPSKRRKNAEDKIFLLSVTEAEKYFQSNKDRDCKPTEYAISQGAARGYTSVDDMELYKFDRTYKEDCKWWLCTPDNESDHAPYVASFYRSITNRRDKKGKLVTSDRTYNVGGEIEKFGREVDDKGTAVRPALWLKTQSQHVAQETVAQGGPVLREKG